MITDLDGMMPTAGCIYDHVLACSATALAHMVEETPGIGNMLAFTWVNLNIPLAHAIFWSGHVSLVYPWPQ